MVYSTISLILRDCHIHFAKVVNYFHTSGNRAQLICSTVLVAFLYAYMAFFSLKVKFRWLFSIKINLKRKFRPIFWMKNVRKVTKTL